MIKLLCFIAAMISFGIIVDLRTDEVISTELEIALLSLALIVCVGVAAILTDKCEVNNDSE